MQVISLCDFTGIMVKPWAEAGHDCLCLDLQHPFGETTSGRITKRRADVRTLTPSDLPKPDIIFAFPPCTNLAVSGARWMKHKGIQGLIDGLQLVEACRKLCEWYQCPWMLENPISILSTCWRKPDSMFHPWEFGDNYTKKTCIWHGGGFVFPTPSVQQEPEDVQQLIWKMSPSPDRAAERSKTPQGFAEAVFRVNSSPADESPEPVDGFPVPDPDPTFPSPGPHDR